MALTKLEIKKEVPYLDGRIFGSIGSYKQLDGVAYFSVDPNEDINSKIVDIDLAPVDAEGLVRFSAHFSILQPADLNKSNRRILLDICNRGNRTVFNNFNSAGPALDPSRELEAGNGFLLRQGYIIVWCGWQADVPELDGLIGMQVPNAVKSDHEIRDKVMNWFQVNEITNRHLLSHSEHTPYKAVYKDEDSAVLYERNHPNQPLEVIDRSSWTFGSSENDNTEFDLTHIYMKSGFQPGKIYQLVYTAEGSRIVGLGFAAIRDFISFLKYSSQEDGNPLAGHVDYSFAFGRSQSGRFLRHLIYLGINIDEKQRIALDGIIAHVAGAMRGEFNLRFGQPSKDICFIMPEMFPFTDKNQVDPVTQKSGSLLSALRKNDVIPKIMFVNTSSEYWRGDAALIHTNLENKMDADEDENIRRYHFAGTQHGSGNFPPMDKIVNKDGDTFRGQIPFNAVDYNPLLRALLINLDKWVSYTDTPPKSCHPSLNKGTAVDSNSLRSKFSNLPHVNFPPILTQAMRLNYGPEIERGIVDILPPMELDKYPAFVSDIDQDCNEIAGIKLPDVTVPLATNTGWNLRHSCIGNPDLVLGISGGLMGWTLPFAKTKKERENNKDPRLSIQERYSSREDYLKLVKSATQVLYNQEFILEEDISRIIDAAAKRYDILTS